MRVRDRIDLAVRGYFAEYADLFRQMREQFQDDWHGTVAEHRQRKQLILAIRRKITGMQAPTRKDERRVMRGWEKEQR
jgi:hypothetical protein